MRAVNNNWKTHKLSEVSELITKGTTPSTYGYKFIDEGVNYIKSDSTSYDGNLDSSVFVSISEEAHEKLKRSQLQEDDILFSIAGAYLGKSGMVKKEHIPANTNQANAIIRVKKEKVLPKFINLLLRNPTLIHYVNASSGQSAQPNLNLTDLGNLELNIPDLKEQTQIANILSAIDDKIEINLSTNKTLEDMAMALYKHWFVDFGPFQDGEFIDSELGLIPKGWEVKPFLEMFKLLSGGTPKTSIDEYWNGKINWVSAKDIGSSGSIYINDTEKKITHLGIDKSATKILPEDTVIVVARGSVGKFGMITKPMCMNQSCYGIYSKSNYSQAITYLLIDSLMKHFLNVAYGSVFDTITTSTFKSINVLQPPNNVMNQIKGEIDILFQNKKTNIEEIETLTKLRDTLLPKLISGEVRLKEFKAQVENLV